MGDFEDKIIKEYDEYLNTLRHIYELGINVSMYNSAIRSLSSKDVHSFVTDEMNSIHKNRVNTVVNDILSDKLGLDKVSEMKTFIEYPNFKVKTYIKNVEYLYKHNTSLERCMLVCPLYELYLVTNNDPCKVLRIRRLLISPNVSIFDIKEEIVSPKMIDSGTKLFSDKFLAKYKTKPSKNDLLALRSLVIKYIMEKVNQDDNTSLDIYNSKISYEYISTKKGIEKLYNVSWVDKFISRSNVTTPWIYKDLMLFDNRDRVSVGSKSTIVPLEYQKLKK